MPFSEKSDKISDCPVPCPVPDFDRKIVIVPSRVPSRILTGCPGSSRPFARFWACPVVLLSLCPGTMKELLSLCPEKLHCPVLMETLGKNLNEPKFASAKIHISQRIGLCNFLAIFFHYCDLPSVIFWMFNSLAFLGPNNPHDILGFLKFYWG